MSIQVFLVKLNDFLYFADRHLGLKNTCNLFEDSAILLN